MAEYNCISRVKSIQKVSLIPKSFFIFFALILISLPNAIDETGEINEVYASYSYPNIKPRVENINIDFGPNKKVCCISNESEPPEVIQPQTEEKIEPEDKTKNIAVLYFLGWPGDFCSGICDHYIAEIPKFFKTLNTDNSKPRNKIKLIMTEFPGVAKSVFFKTIMLLESDLIDKADYRQLEKYDAAILKKLKEENGGRLHAIGHSLGGLRILHAYLTLSEKDREGISISLIDPFIPSKSPQHSKLFKFIRFMNFISPTYDWSFYNIATLPLTIVGRFLSFYIDFCISGLLKEIRVRVKSNITDLIRYSSEQEAKLLKLLKQAKNESLDIRQVTVMTKDASLSNSLSGFGKYPEYTEFLEKELLPKCKKSADGNMLQLEKLAQYNHLDFAHDYNFLAKYIKKGIE